MLVDFPDPGTSVAIHQHWQAPTIKEHSPEFARHYRLAGEKGELWCELVIAAKDGDSATVTGRAGFSPTLSCGRCLKQGQVAVTTDIAVTVQHERYAATAENDELELDSGMLDVYSRTEPSVDLIQIVIDAVELAVPDFRAATGCCELVGEDGQNALVARGGNPEALNPFSALKGLKDKLKN